MDPITLGTSLLSAGTSLYGAITGNNARKKELALAQQQFDAQQNLAQEQAALARELQKQGLATQVDAMGNVTFYDKATNTWKSVLAPRQQRIQDAGDTETIRSLTEDAAAQRAQRGANADRRNEESGVASSLLQQIKQRIASGGQYNADTIAANTRLENRGNVQTAFDQAENTAARMNMRTGATGNAGQIARLAQARAQSLAAANPGTYLSSLEAAQSLNQNDQNGLANRYNMMATRASSIDNATINPQNPGSSLSSALAAARAGGTQGTAAQINGLNAAGNTMRSAQAPNYAASAGDFTADLGKFFSNVAQGDIGNYLSNALKKRKPASTNTWQTNVTEF
jgi:hypothetical protein